MTNKVGPGYDGSAQDLLDQVGSGYARPGHDRSGPERHWKRWT